MTTTTARATGRAKPTVCRHGGTRTALLLALVGVALGCAAGDEIDLVEVFDGAATFVETEWIDVGDPGARWLMTEGWSPRDELWAGRLEQSFVWGVGNGSEVRVHLVQPRQDLLQIVARPRVENGEQLVTTLHISLNGSVLPSGVPLRQGWQEYVVRLPDRFVQAGENRIGFGYDLPYSSGGDGNLRVAFDSLRVVRGTPRSYPRLDLPGGPPRLLVPFLSGITYTVDTTPGATLTLEALRAYGRPTEGPVRLIVRLDHDEVAYHAVEAPFPDFELELPAAEGLRITMMAAPSDDFYELTGHEAEQDAGLLLQRPRVRLR